MWGTEDLLAGLGGCSSRWPDGRYRDVAVHARNTDLISASAKGKADVPHFSLSVWPPTWEMGCSLALVTGALIEREIRNAMANAGTSHIPLYPELRACTAPSAARILELFSDLTRHQLRHDGQIVQTFHPELSPLQDQVLQLLQIPTTNYTPRAPKS